MDYYKQIKIETDRYIFKALLELMEIRPYQQIRVSEICLRAEVSRKTFYRHFNSISHVLDTYFEWLCQKYIASHPVLETYDFEIICEDFFSFWKPYQKELQIIQNSLGFGSITLLILKNSQKVVEHRSGMEASKFALYSTGGLCAILEESLLKKEDISEDRFAKEFSGIISSILKHE